MVRIGIGRATWSFGKRVFLEIGLCVDWGEKIEKGMELHLYPQSE